MVIEGKVVIKNNTHTVILGSNYNSKKGVKILGTG